jgi:serine phosphatase RsbU (regulator of sigma subunit)
LQHAVLPERLPQIDGWEIASHYQPAGRTDIGGDFYDAIPTADGNVALVVGDVMGRGVAAAAAMAQMRAAVRAYAALDPDPKAVLDSLDRLFSNDEIAQLVTLVYCLTDRARGELVIINAGHLPTLRLLGPDAELLRLPVSLPLGVGPDIREPVRIAFPAGATFLAFTDGLVERRDEDIDAGLDRVREHARLLPDGPLDVQLQALVDAMCSPRGGEGSNGTIGGYGSASGGCGGSSGVNDDVTLLGLRRVRA